MSKLRKRTKDGIIITQNMGNKKNIKRETKAEQRKISKQKFQFNDKINEKFKMMGSDLTLKYSGFKET